MSKADVKKELAKRAGAIKGGSPAKPISDTDTNVGADIDTNGDANVGVDIDINRNANVDIDANVDTNVNTNLNVDVNAAHPRQDPETAGAAIRLLRADEIECRVSTINEKGMSLLLFKDARVDQRILDETFTPFGWKRTHQCIDGNLYCTVEIWDGEKRQWIAKQDVGTTSYSEKEKGQASDSFKRACFNWGLGRELYTAPFIWVPAEKVNIQKKDSRYITSDRFSVLSIGYNEQREISALVIINQNRQKVFEMKQKPERKQGQKTEEQKQTPDKEEQKPSQDAAAADRHFILLEKELERTGISMQAVLSRYHLTGVEQMTEDIYTRAMNGLKKTKTKDAA